MLKIRQSRPASTSAPTCSTIVVGLADGELLVELGAGHARAGTPWCRSVSSALLREHERAEPGRRDLAPGRGRRRRSARAARRACGATVSGPPVTLHMSAYCATSRSVRFSPLPPIMIGGPPGWIGRGTLRASVDRVVAARERRAFVAEHRAADLHGLLEPVEALAARSGSRSRSRRARARTTRRRCRGSPGPFEMTSSVVTILASSAGLRYVTPVTSVPSCTRSVRAASAPSSVYASRIGSSGPPSGGQLPEVVHHPDRLEAASLGRLRRARRRVVEHLVVGYAPEREVRELEAERGHRSVLAAAVIAASAAVLVASLAPFGQLGHLRDAAGVLGEVARRRPRVRCPVLVAEPEHLFVDAAVGGTVADHAEHRPGDAAALAALGDGGGLHVE